MKKQFTFLISLLLCAFLLNAQEVKKIASKNHPGISVEQLQSHVSEQHAVSAQIDKRGIQKRTTSLEELKISSDLKKNVSSHTNDETYTPPDFPYILGNFTPRSPLPLDYATEFDGSLDGWTSVSIVGGKNFVWTTTGGAYGGQLMSTTASNGYAMFDNLDGAAIGPNPAEAALVSPALDFSSVVGASMTFEHMARHLGQGFNPAYPNLVIKVEVSTDMFDTDIQEVWSYTFPTTEHFVYQGEELVSLNILAGEPEAHIRFRYIGGGGYWWLIDDIDIFATFNNDLAVTRAKFSQELNFEGDDVTLSALITNLGLQTQTNVTVTFNVDGQDFFGNIPSIDPVESLLVSTQWINATAGRHLITVTLPNDENNANNTGTTQGVVAAIGQLAEGFEGALFPPANWEAEPGWINWVQDWSSQWEGLKSAAAGNNMGFNNIKLITPLLDIVSGDELNFYATVGNAIQGQPTTIQIMRSMDKSSWTNIGALINLTPQMTLYTIDLTSLAGGSYYLAFSATGAPSNAAWSTWAIVDHVVGPALFVFECPNPVSLTTSNITSSSARANWLAGGTETLWDIEYGPFGFAQGTGTLVSGHINPNPFGNPYFEIGGLDDGTAYSWYVRADCGTREVSDWVGPINFTTYCDFVCPPGAIAESEPCGDNLNGGCNMAIPAFEIVNPGDIICGTLWATGGSRDTDWFELVISETSEVTLHAYAETVMLFGKINGIDPTNPDCADVTGISPSLQTTLCSPAFLNLGVLTPGTYWLFAGLTVFNGFPCDVNYWIEFEVNVLDCPPVTDLTVTDVTTSGATLGWTPGGSETLWNVEVGLPGFEPGTMDFVAQILGTDLTEWIVSTLNHSTIYEFYVQADCGAAGESFWEGAAFATACDVFQPPYQESFDIPYWPACWDETLEGSLIGDIWFLSNSNEAGGDAFELLASWEDNIGTSRLIMPVMDLSSRSGFGLSFKHFYVDFAAGTTFKIQSSSDGINWTDEAFSFSSGGGNIGPETVTVPITTSSSTTYIAFVIDGDHYSFDFWYIDDVVVDEMLYQVTFNVDMEAVPGFDHDTEEVYIAGSFPGAFWDEPGTNPNLLMTRVGATDIYTITLELPAGAYDYKYFRNATWSNGEWGGGPNRNVSVNDNLTVNDIFGRWINWANLQWPPNGTITLGGNFDVYAQVFAPGKSGSGPVPGLSAWIGFSENDVDPVNFTEWVPATFNLDAGDNAEYTANIGPSIPGTGTYYYASRFQFENGEFAYGGFQGGFWDGINNVSGVLTVNPDGYLFVSGEIDDCLDATDEVEIDGATVENGAIADIRSGGTITAINFEVKEGGTAYLTAEESISLGEGVLVAPGATGLALFKIDTFAPCVLPVTMLASEEVIVAEELPQIALSESFFSVFPNPTTGHFTLELKEVESASVISVEIFSMMGERVMQNQLFGQQQYEFDLSNSPRGMYIVRVLFDGEIGIERLIKQ